MKKNYRLSLITLVICVLSFSNAMGQDTEKPSVPTGLAISSKTETTVTLSWNPSTDNVGIEFYQVYKNGNWQAGTADTFFIVTDIDTTLSYTFAVDAYDAAGNGSAPCEAILMGVADTQAPSVPQNLVASEITQTSFNLTWDASTDNNGTPSYEIFVNDEWVGAVAGLTKTIEGLTCGTRYSITVNAFDGASPANISEKSAALELTTAECNYISNPGYEDGLAGWGPWENMNIDTVSQRSGNACMRAGNGIAGGNGGGNTAVSDLVVGKKYVITTWGKLVNDSSDVIPDQVAYMAVQFVDAAWAEVSGTLTADITGYTDWAQSEIEFTVPVGCEIVSPYIWLAGGTEDVFMLIDDWKLVEVAEADTVAPTVPQNLVASEITQNSVTLSWDASTDNSGTPDYYIYVNDERVDTVAGLTTTIEGLTCESTYTINIEAFDGASPANISEKSAALELTTAECNYISNPGYEDGLAGWGPWENMNIDTVSQRSGNACMRAGNGIAGGNGGGNTAVSDLVVGKKYVITTWGKLVNDSSDVIPDQVAYMAVQFVDAAWAEVSGTLTADITGYTDWAQSEIEFTVPVGCEIVSPYIWLAGGTEDVFMLIDDWKLVEVAEADTVAPTVPQNLVASEITQNSVTLSWDASTDNSGTPDYYIYVNDERVDTVAGLTTTIEGLTCESTYTINIEAFDGASPANISEKSAALEVTTPECNLLSNPGFEEGFEGWGVWEAMYLDSISPRTGKYCMLAGPVQGGGAAGYNPVVGKSYEYSVWTKFIGPGDLTKPSNSHIGIAFLDSEGDQMDIATAGIKITADWSQTTMQITVPEGCVTIVPYVWETAAVADVSMLFDDTKLVEIILVVDTEKPSTPSGLVVADITETSFTLSWNKCTDNVGVTEYELYLDGSFAGTTVDTFKVISNLENNTSYIVSLRAYDAAENFSEESPQITVITLMGSVGISDNQLFENVIFPNPASSRFSISNITAHSNIVVLTTDGKIISNVKSVGDEMSFDVSSWNKGIYFIAIQSKENSVVKKVVVQ